MRPCPRSKRAPESGRIDLVLPEKAAFQLDATAEQGEAVNDFGAPITSDTEGRTSTLKGKVGNGPTIQLTARRGSVSVRKEGMAPSEVSPPEPPEPPSPGKLPKLPSKKGTEI